MSVLVARDVLVQVGQAAGRRLGDVAQLVPRHHVGLQVVGQRALRGRGQEVGGGGCGDHGNDSVTHVASRTHANQDQQKNRII